MAISTAIASERLTQRLTGVRARMGEYGLAGALITSPHNIRYLTGFTGSALGLLLSSRSTHLLIDGRYGLRAHAEVSSAGAAGVEVCQTTPTNLVGELRTRLPREGVIGLEDSTLWKQAEELVQSLAPRSIVPTIRLVEELRLRKDLGEIACISAAAAITDALLDAVAMRDFAGRSVADVRKFIAASMLDFDVKPAFDSIVLSGEHTSQPHGRADSHTIQPDQPVLVDIGSEVAGYLSDMTRILCWGELSGRFLELYTIAGQAHESAVAALTVGGTYGDVDEAARSVFRQYDLERYALHPTGHNVGLEIHERPFFATCDRNRTVEEGHVVTIEPGVYLDAIGGARIEDLYVVTASGPRRLTHSPRLPAEPASRKVADRVSRLVAQESGQLGQESWPDLTSLDPHARFLAGDDL